MFERLSKYLSRIGVNYAVVQDGHALDFEVQAPEGKWNCLLSVHSAEGVGIYSTILNPVPKKRRAQMALFLMYLNNNHVFGNFELDLKTGDVRFKMYLDCESLELTERVIDRTMLLNVTTMQRYYPQIMRIIEAA